MCLLFYYSIYLYEGFGIGGIKKGGDYQGGGKQRNREAEQRGKLSSANKAVLYLFTCECLLYMSGILENVNSIPENLEKLRSYRYQNNANMNNVQYQTCMIHVS